MNLSHSISEAREGTRHLQAALEAGDTDAAVALTADRAKAMAALEADLRVADDDSLARCRDDLMALQDEDATLQQLAAGTLADVDEACRSDLGGAPTGLSAYRDEPALACVDRRA